MSKQPQVLIVEDDGWLAEQYIRTLKMANIQAVVVTNAMVAMDSIDANMPDVLVLDVLVPGPNIFTLLHELRSHVDLAAIPVILCTNSADALADEDLIVYGIRVLLDKATMVPGDLVAAVKKVLL